MLILSYETINDETINNPALFISEYFHNNPIHSLLLLTALYCFDSLFGRPELPIRVRTSPAGQPPVYAYATPCKGMIDPVFIMVGLGVIVAAGIILSSYASRRCDGAEDEAEAHAATHNCTSKSLFSEDVTNTATAVADRPGKADAAIPMQANFQTPASDIGTKINDLHHDLMFFLVAIVVFVSYALVTGISRYRSDNTTTSRVAFAHHTLLEKIWTYVPAGILVLIASPSFSLLYAIDALAEPQITVKVIGHQWYWTYETTDYHTSKDISFDSYMMLESDLPRGGLRLLEVDNRLPLPVRTNMRLIITAADVLHSWALPALGVKMDACPGRLNQVSLHINRSGAFFGQCSELCGINHSFMPIVVDAVISEQYQRWINTQE